MEKCYIGISVRLRKHFACTRGGRGRQRGPCGSTAGARDDDDETAPPAPLARATGADGGGARGSAAGTRDDDDDEAAPPAPRARMAGPHAALGGGLDDDEAAPPTPRARARSQASPTLFLLHGCYDSKVVASMPWGSRCVAALGAFPIPLSSLSSARRSLGLCRRRCSLLPDYRVLNRRGGPLPLLRWQRHVRIERGSGADK
uniref:Uncharacterized protein n=1 Tax=Oryza sativa subsp. japonica TaxID=39947 RepID=Q6ZG76_ORYSJ|nr:hypothetical protein [Oryza sativa Japonica Group]